MVIQQKSIGNELFCSNIKGKLAEVERGGWKKNGRPFHVRIERGFNCTLYRTIAMNRNNLKRHLACKKSNLLSAKKGKSIVNGSKNGWDRMKKKYELIKKLIVISFNLAINLTESLYCTASCLCVCVPFC